MKVLLKLYAELNIGDDLFLRIILDRYPHISFYLNAKKEYNVIAKEYKNLTVFQSDNTKTRNISFKIYKRCERTLFPQKYKKNLQKDILNNTLNVIREVDMFVSIGGSVFMQPKKLPAYADIEYYKIIQENIKYTFFIGGNFGPYSDLYYKKSYDEIFRKAIDVCFRENYSKGLFEKLENVRYAPDIVFSLGEEVYDFFDKEDRIKRSIGFCIINPKSGNKNIDTEEYIHNYSLLISKFIEKKYSIKLFSFCGKGKDENVINRIYNKIKSKDNIKKLFYSGDINNFMKEYASVESMFCGRFHSMILSMKLDQKIYPVIYSDKMMNVLKDIKYEGKYVYISDLGKLKLEEIEKDLYNNHFEISSEIKDAEKHFLVLDKYLK
jgi:colanic acid/amylovoran biosynthesis protein